MRYPYQKVILKKRNQVHPDSPWQVSGLGWRTQKRRVTFGPSAMWWNESGLGCRLALTSCGEITNNLERPIVGSQCRTKTRNCCCCWVGLEQRLVGCLGGGEKEASSGVGSSCQRFCWNAAPSNKRWSKLGIRVAVSDGRFTKLHPLHGPRQEGRSLRSMYLELMQLISKAQAEAQFNLPVLVFFL